MKIKEIVKELKDAKKIYLGFNGVTIEYIKENELMAAAYGDFLVNGVYAIKTDETGTEYEINVAIMPLKGGD